MSEPGPRGAVEIGSLAGSRGRSSVAGASRRTNRDAHASPPRGAPAGRSRRRPRRHQARAPRGEAVARHRRGRLRRPRPATRCAPAWRPRSRTRSGSRRWSPGSASRRCCPRTAERRRLHQPLPHRLDARRAGPRPRPRAPARRARHRAVPAPAGRAGADPQPDRRSARHHVDAHARDRRARVPLDRRHERAARLLRLRADVGDPHRARRARSGRHAHEAAPARRVRPPRLLPHRGRATSTTGSTAGSSRWPAT